MLAGDGAIKVKGGLHDVVESCPGSTRRGRVGWVEHDRRMQVAVAAWPNVPITTPCRPAMPVMRLIMGGDGWLGHGDVEQHRAEPFQRWQGSAAGGPEEFSLGPACDRRLASSAATPGKCDQAHLH
jgi:hypothetical protein